MGGREGRRVGRKEGRERTGKKEGRGRNLGGGGKRRKDVSACGILNLLRCI
jgi:hypothetical protein